MPVLSTLGAAIANVYGFTSGLIKDQYFNLVSLLLPGNGTNGATNNSFVDSSTANSGTGWPITRNGDVTQGTFSPFSQTGWGGYFNGSSRLSSASGSVIDFGANNFTVEMWVYLTSSSNNMMLLEGPSDNGFQFYVETGVLKAGVSGGSVGPTYTLPSTFWNSWNHIAVVRSGTGTNQTVMYVNGSAVSTNTISASTSVTGFQIARTSGYTLYGYVSNVRIIKNQALFSGNFTPSILPLTTTSAGATGANVASSITGTVSLLTCQSNRFIDNSGTVSSITVSGTAITPFSPFAPTSSYSAAAVGGSGYFDGSGDYLTVPDSTALDLPGDFTIECWLYRTANTNNTILYTIGNYSGSNNGFTLYVEAGNNLRCYGNGGFIFTGTAGLVPLNAWVHIALIRSGSGSNNMKAYINGVLDTAAQASNNSSWTGVAGNGFSPGAFYDGTYNAQTEKTYMAGMRLVKGQALASGDFTPPTAPVTTSSVGWTGANAAGSLTGTISLLLNFTNAGVVDATAKNDLQTVGNAQISNGAGGGKWGGGSIAFDGTSGTYANGAPTTVPLGGGDFVVELWLYINASKAQGVFDTRASSASTAGIALYLTSGNVWQMVVNNAGFNAGGSITNSVWTHVAVVRTGTTLYLYVGGSLVNSTGLSNNLTDTTFLAGTLRDNADATTTWKMNGYIDDLRITKGNNRGYTGSSITVPTAPFPLR
jgi:hypothetical protein